MKNNITMNMKMADLIHLNYNLTLIINRFGITLGFGDKSVETICGEYGINPDFFIEIVNAFHDKGYSPSRQLVDFPVKDTVKYLQNTHNYYVEDEVPKIEMLIDNVIEINKDQAKPLSLMKNFFIEYRTELVNHIKKEEQTVYPYAVKIEKAYKTGVIPEGLGEEFRTYSMEAYEREHEDVEEKLLDLKNIIIKYLPAPADNRFYNDILFSLFRLEADLNEHSRIENTVLIPTIRFMEKELNLQKAD